MGGHYIGFNLFTACNDSGIMQECPDISPEHLPIWWAIVVPAFIGDHCCARCRLVKRQAMRIGNDLIELAVEHYNRFRIVADNSKIIKRVSDKKAGGKIFFCK